jgi:hypothetical protein
MPRETKVIVNLVIFFMVIFQVVVIAAGCFGCEIEVIDRYSASHIDNSGDNKRVIG